MQRLTASPGIFERLFQNSPLELGPWTCWYVWYVWTVIYFETDKYWSHCLACVPTMGTGISWEPSEERGKRACDTARWNHKWNGRTYRDCNMASGEALGPSCSWCCSGVDLSFSISFFCWQQKNKLLTETELVTDSQLVSEAAAGWKSS